MLALGRHAEGLNEPAVLRKYADAVRQLGVTRARMSQVMDLLLLSSNFHQMLLIDDIPVTERTLRIIPQEMLWEAQYSARKSLLGKH